MSVTIIGTLPVILQNGTTADASQVMSDFNFIVNQVNANGLSTAFIAPGTLLNIQVFTVNGTYTPTANANRALWRVVGAGGAGGGAPATGGGALSLGVGGSAGAYGEMFISGGLVTQTITIGTGGVGVSGAAGNSGTATSVGALMVCGGGLGGGTVGPSAPPFILGTLNTPATVTGSGPIILIAPGANPEGPAIALANAAFGAFSGAGANSVWGAGGIGSAVGNGGNATLFGAGGGGSSNGVSSGARSGGSGSNGYAMVFEFA